MQDIGFYFIWGLFWLVVGGRAGISLQPGCLNQLFHGKPQTFFIFEESLFTSILHNKDKWSKALSLPFLPIINFKPLMERPT